MTMTIKIIDVSRFTIVGLLGYTDSLNIVLIILNLPTAKLQAEQKSVMCYSAIVY